MGYDRYGDGDEEEVEEERRLMIVVGDFNFNSTSHGYRRLVADAGLESAAAAAAGVGTPGAGGGAVFLPGDSGSKTASSESNSDSDSDSDPDPDPGYKSESESRLLFVENTEAIGGGMIDPPPGTVVDLSPGFRTVDAPNRSWAREQRTRWDDYAVVSLRDEDVDGRGTDDWAVMFDDEDKHDRRVSSFSLSRNNAERETELVVGVVVDHYDENEPCAGKQGFLDGETKKRCDDETELLIEDDTELGGNAELFTGGETEKLDDEPELLVGDDETVKLDDETEINGGQREGHREEENLGGLGDELAEVAGEGVDGDGGALDFVFYAAGLGVSCVGYEVRREYSQERYADGYPSVADFEVPCPRAAVKVDGE